ncbi:protein phosphatase 2C domain-containing protein [Candidatus Dependentiae bacterium]|nr:protein phosphatase 2C domain-containing protein [Candidatus Dependentiae bacterium]
MKIKFLFLNLIFFSSIFSITQVGHFSMQGRRPAMEDAHQILNPFNNSKNAFFAIYDGHGCAGRSSKGAKTGGNSVSNYCAQNLHKYIDPKSNPEQALNDAFKQVDKDLLIAHDCKTVGSCAIVSYFVNDELYIANLGDSKAIICNQGQAVELSQDHKPSRSDERERIEKAGGFVAYNGCSRVNGFLAISRAFGDAFLKAYGVSAIPEIKQYKITEQDQFLILACDGIFEVMNPQEAVDVVNYFLNENYSLKNKAELAAKYLAQTAYSKGSGDNLSVIVVLLNNF